MLYNGARSIEPAGESKICISYQQHDNTRQNAKKNKKTNNNKKSFWAKKQGHQQ
jgi:hypothetical protein